MAWVLRIALAVVFLGAGVAKLTGDAAMVDLFAEVGAGQWLRWVVGAAEVLGAVGLLVPRLVIVASLGLALLMAGATIANLTVLDDSPVLTVVLCVAALLVFAERRSALTARR